MSLIFRIIIGMFFVVGMEMANSNDRTVYFFYDGKHNPVLSQLSNEGSCTVFTTLCSPSSGIHTTTLPISFNQLNPVKVDNVITISTPTYDVPVFAVTPDNTIIPGGAKTMFTIKVFGWGGTIQSNPRKANDVAIDYPEFIKMYPNPCQYYNVHTSGVNFLWTMSRGGPYNCFIKGSQPLIIHNMSMYYQIEFAKDLINLPSGYYLGSFPVSVGKGRDIDFGDNYIASKNSVIVSVNLFINRDFKFNFNTSVTSSKVVMQPCSDRKICTEGEGAVNWKIAEKQKLPLTGRVDFKLNSSIPFEISIDCKYYKDSDCALYSDNSSTHSAVQTMLTFDGDTFLDENKMKVDYAKFIPGIKKSFFPNGNGSKDQNINGFFFFSVNPNEVKTMLDNPDTYRGVVSLIFGPIMPTAPAP